MRISDGSSDVCSSDLARGVARQGDQRFGRQYIARRSALLDAPLGVVEGRNRAGEGRAAPSCELSGKGGPILPEDGLALRGDSAFDRSEEHTSELQSLMRISYAVFCLKKKKHTKHTYSTDRKQRKQE